MVSNFCPDCGEQVDDALFCPNCGKKQNIEEAPAKPVNQPPPQNQPPSYTGSTGQQYPPGQQPYNPNQQYPPGQRPYNPNQQYPPGYAPRQQFMGRPMGYVRPPGYVFTKTIMERIIGTLKFDVDVVEEIEEREDLQEEAQKLFYGNLIVIALISIISKLSGLSIFTIVSPIGTITRVLIEVIAGGIVYVYVLARVGRSVGGLGTETSDKEIIRVLAYAYVAVALSELLSLFANMGGTGLVSLLSLVVFIYSLFVVLFAIKRALDKGYGTAIITVILSLIIVTIFRLIVEIIVDSLFGGSYFLP